MVLELVLELELELVQGLDKQWLPEGLPTEKRILSYQFDNIYFLRTQKNCDDCFDYPVTRKITLTK